MAVVIPGNIEYSKWSMDKEYRKYPMALIVAGNVDYRKCSVALIIEWNIIPVTFYFDSSSHSSSYSGNMQC